MFKLLITMAIFNAGAPFIKYYTQIFVIAGWEKDKMNMQRRPA